MKKGLMARLETEIAIVGTGPGGATAARELARRGRSVVLVEKGRWHTNAVGRYRSVGAITRIVAPRGGFGLMARGVSVGGSTVVFSGNAYDPPLWLKDELGIDLTREVAETRREIGIRPLPDSFFDQWPATRRMMTAAADLGITLKPQDKYIDPDKCDPTCDDCMVGCGKVIAAISVSGHKSYFDEQSKQQKVTALLRIALQISSMMGYIGNKSEEVYSG